MRRALRLARRGLGTTSPNPMVGAVLVRGGRILGEGWHAAAGGPHAEIVALRAALDSGHAGDLSRAVLYVTLEPCCTQGRTPPCTEAILAAGIRRVVVAAVDPNPLHAGRGLIALRERGVEVVEGLLENQATSLNEAFNHWIVSRVPFVTVKAAMTLDGRIATAAGESKWITGKEAREFGMRLRKSCDGILVGVNTIIADNPRLTLRDSTGRELARRRFILDSHARTPLTALVLTDDFRSLTTVIVSESAPSRRVDLLRSAAQVCRAPLRKGRVNLDWLLKSLGSEGVTHLLVEGGGEVNASFLEGGLAQKVAFFYAPVVLGGRAAVRAVGGVGGGCLAGGVNLSHIRWRKLGPDLLMIARPAWSDDRHDPRGRANRPR